MSIQSLYQDRKGRPEPMDYVVDEEQDNESDAMQTEDAKNDTDVLMREPSARRSYTFYTVQDKLGIRIRTARRYKRVPDSIFEKRKKKSRSRILNEEHQKIILECIDENPSSVLEQLMERLRQIFRELKLSKSAVYDFVRTHCSLSLKKARFRPIDRNSEEKIQERLDWVCKREGTDMDFRSNCVFLDESDLGTGRRARYPAIVPPLTMELLRHVITKLHNGKLNMTLTTQIKDVIIGYRDGHISHVSARRQLMEFAENANGPDRNVTLAVEALIPALKDLNLGPVGESELSALFVHPFIQGGRAASL